MADEEIALKIEIESDRAQMSLEELEKGFDGLQEKLKGTKRNTEEGRAEFKKLSSQLAQASGEIKNLELGFEGLDREQITSEFVGMAGGIGDVTASLVLMGGENETIEQIGASIEKALAISMGIKGVMEGAASANKLYTNSVRAKAVVEKVAAAGTWLLNTANKALNTTLKMNPIGLILIALTAVVGAIVYFKDAIMNVMEVALKPFQFLIDLVIDGLQAMGIMQSDAANASAKLQEAYEKELKSLEKLADKEKERSDAMVSQIQRQIQVAEAQGKSTEDLSRSKLSQVKKNTEAEIEALNKRIKIAHKDLELKRLDENVSKEVYDEKVAQYHDLTKLQRETSEKLKDDKANLYSWDLEQLEVRRQKVIDDAAAEDTRRKASSAKRKAQREKDKAAEDKAAADAEKAAADAIALEIEKNKLLEDLEAKAIQDKTTRALAELEIAQERERAQLIEKYGLDTELMLALETEQLLQMNTLIEGIEQEARDKSAALDQEARDKQAVLDQEQRDKDLAADQKALDDKREQREKDFALATAAIGALSALNDAALATDLLNAAGNDEKQEKIRRASFERQKKLNIAMAAINGAQAVIAGFAQGGLPMAILAGVTAAAQLAAIVATTYQSSATPTEVEETVPTPDGAGGGGGGAQINAVTNTSTILGNQQVFVTETDITDTQNNVSVIEESATF